MHAGLRGRTFVGAGADCPPFRSGSGLPCNWRMDMNLQRSTARHATAGGTAEGPRPGRYTVDSMASTVTFSTRHLFGLAPVRGTFTMRSGSVEVAEHLAATSIRAEIDTASFSTGNRQRDRRVRSARFLDVDRQPLITFVSGRVEVGDGADGGGDGVTVDGTLTVGAVSRPVSLLVDRIFISSEGFTARARTCVDRTEFGVTAARGLAGRRLDLTLEVTCIRRT